MQSTPAPGSRPETRLPRVRITRREEFSAAHRLHSPELTDEQNARLYGLCNNFHGHGHNYELEVSVVGSLDPRTGMVMNLTDLMHLVRERVVARLDHKHLNHDVDFLRGRIPTAENLAVAIWEELAPSVAGHPGCRLEHVRLWESRDNLVDYFGPEADGAARAPRDESCSA